jgi:archaellum component FlaF (FlaF/FlaG flagellin family)
MRKESKITEVTIVENGTIFTKQVVAIFDDDGTIITTSNHRSSYIPSESLSALPPEAKAIAEIRWTPDVIEAHVPVVVDTKPVTELTEQ